MPKNVKLNISADSITFAVDRHFPRWLAKSGRSEVLAYGTGYIRGTGLRYSLTVYHKLDSKAPGDQGDQGDNWTAETEDERLRSQLDQAFDAWK